MKDFVDEEMGEGGYRDPSDYFNALLQEQLKRKAEQKLEGLLQEGLATDSAPVDKKDWEYLRRAAILPLVMSTNLDQLTDDAMKLPLRDRVQLAQRLVSTLADEVEADTEALWFAEAELRLEELRSGKVQGVSAKVSFRNAREALKR
ncbi:MAG: hypothetical protein QOG23_3071 [Blastocatellia bacterium]|jgi:Arc/MetJ-type ribon-helix-helix transcriptional regulator|nr:hypothetical protein [Blastocatellia bacterium]